MWGGRFGYGEVVLGVGRWVWVCMGLNVHRYALITIYVMHVCYMYLSQVMMSYTLYDIITCDKYI